jgi:hypothetical protein
VKSIHEVSRNLQWIHPDLTKRHFELRDETDVAATLTWEKPTGSIAIARSEAGAWSFKRLGFLNPRVSAIDLESRAQVARFDAAISGAGVAQTKDGYTFRWYSNLWRAEWGWIDSGGNDLLKFRRSFDVEEKKEGRLEILDAAHDHRHLALLALMGWYLIILIAEPPEAD